jgi:hypothetical protein
MPDENSGRGLVHAGELLKPMQRALDLTPARAKLLDAAASIRMDPDAVERAYLARQLVQCTLPHRDPGDVEVWTRTNGSRTLVMQRGYDDYTKKLMGYPWGSIPRLLLFWINSEAVRTNSRRLELGRTLSEFMLDLDLNPDNGTGKRSDARRLREQMLRLFCARISFQQSGPNSRLWLSMDVTAGGELWWNHRRPQQATLWNSWIELGEKFFGAITAAPVPADMRALRALKRSPLALDLYAWLTYKAFVVSRNGAAQTVPWAGLIAQIGAEYGRLNNFRTKATAALRKIQTVYPGLKLRRTEHGITILAGSKPAVAPLKKPV